MKADTVPELMEERLLTAFQQLQLSIDAQQVKSLLRFVEQMQRWNKTYNLTAIKAPQEMLVQHVFDSLAIVPSVQQVLGSNSEGVIRPGQILDVGSGGGLPGIVLAICLPQVGVCCVDAVEKKVAFIRQMSGVLRLANLKAEHARVERLANVQADIIVSRAFASLRDFVVLSEHHAKPSGVFLAMKGREPGDEIAALKLETGWQASRVETLQVPGLDAERCLVWIERKGNA